MGLTHFPHGVSSFGLPVLPSSALIPATTGNIFFVSSTAAKRGDSTHKGRSPDTPFATLDYAIGRCTANNGDVIVVMPNHAETITGAGGITADVAGITIVGLGSFNQRPRFLMDGGTTVTFAVSAADVTVRNMVFSSGNADVVACFAITAAGCWLDMIEFDENTTNEDWLSPIKATSTTDNNADGLKVTNCRWLQASASGLEFVELNANLKGLVVHNNLVIHEGTASPLILVATGKIFTVAQITWNFLAHKMTANEMLVNNDGSTSTGIIAHNRVGHADVTTTHDLGIDALGCRLFDNLSTSVDNLQGVVVPAADVNS
jgi:hypothetical protein